ncbi:MAG: multicopper oxidase domain-containing protein [Methylocella sp.]|nr:MAG: hypothetical protein DLM68_02830 [Hyphomicrobiales bacterium]
MPAPLSVIAASERVELAVANQTMMPHPAHLHGHSFQNLYPIRQSKLAPSSKS